MESSQLSSLADGGTRIVEDVPWRIVTVFATPTEQRILVYDTRTHKATDYIRSRPNPDSDWWDWKVLGEIDLQ